MQYQSMGEIAFVKKPNTTCSICRGTSNRIPDLTARRLSFWMARRCSRLALYSCLVVIFRCFHAIRKSPNGTVLMLV